MSHLRHTIWDKLVHLYLLSKFWSERGRFPPGKFSAYMDGASEDFLQFSMGVFNHRGQIKPPLYQPSRRVSRKRDRSLGPNYYIEDMYIVGRDLDDGRSGNC